MTDAGAGAGSQAGDDLPQVPHWHEVPEIGAFEPTGSAGMHDASVQNVSVQGGSIQDASIQDGSVLDADASTPTTLVPQAHLDALMARAGLIVPPLAKAVSWLRLPSLILVVAAAAGPLLLGLLALSWQGWPRPVGIVVALLALVPVVRLASARSGTLAAARNPAALTDELAGFTAHLNGGLAVLDKLAAVVEGGGLRLMWRLRALWEIVQLPKEATDHLDRLPNLRWFLPPQVPETWVRLTTAMWSSVGCYALTGFLGSLSLTSVL